MEQWCSLERRKAMDKDQVLQEVRDHLSRAFHDGEWCVKTRKVLVERVEELYMLDQIPWHIAADVLTALGEDVW